MQASGKKNEFSTDIMNAMGYDGVKSMKAENFLRKYMMVKVFMDLDVDKNGFLDRTEIGKHLKMDKNANELKEAFKQFDLNGTNHIKTL